MYTLEENGRHSLLLYSKHCMLVKNGRHSILSGEWWALHFNGEWWMLGTLVENGRRCVETPYFLGEWWKLCTVAKDGEHFALWRRMADTMYFSKE